MCIRDRAISANTYYVPERYPENMLPLQEIIDDILFAHSIGVKTLYYQNTKVSEKDGMEEAPIEKRTIQPTIIRDDQVGCEGGGCSL